MSIHKPKKSDHPLYSGYTSGPTPIADFIEMIVNGTAVIVIVPIFVVALAAAPSALLVYGLGGATGLTAAWAELVLQATSPALSAVPLATMLAQNLAWGALLGLLLAIPTVRRYLGSYRVRDTAHSVGTSILVAAMQMSLPAVLLYVVSPP